MSILFYRLFLALYWLGAVFLSLFNKKAKRWLTGRKNLFAELARLPPASARRTIWIHCSSLGEFEQARPVLENLRRAYPGCFILLSFFSPSGYDIRKDYPGADAVTYLPPDRPVNAEKFLGLVEPELVVWVKYDYWYFYLTAIKRRNIPLLLVSGIFRPQQPFFRSWGHFHRSMLHCFTMLFVQNRASADLLAAAGFTRVIVSGDTRFDRVAEIARQQISLPLVEAFVGTGQVVVAGSTWEEDEEELDHYANTHPEIKFIIAPHETDGERLLDIEKLFRRCIRYSDLEGRVGPREASGGFWPSADAFAGINVLLIDSIGLLATLYRYGTVAYVGGGFGDDGVHNVLEAAVYGRPVIFGPEYDKYAEAVGLVAAGGAFDVENALELEKTLDILLSDGQDYRGACESAGKFVQDNTGATGIIMNYIQEKRLFTS